MPILMLIWGMISAAWAAVLSAATAAVTFVVASRAMTVLVIGLALAGIVLAIPMPSWIEALPLRVAALPSNVVWGLEFIEAKIGLGIVMGAYVTKFVTRLAIKVVTS